MINNNNLIVDINKVKPNNYNPKQDYNDSVEGKKNFLRVLKSLERHGQIDPLLVREKGEGYEIVNGYHRFKAMQELGFKEVEIKNLGKISDAKAKAIALATEDAKIPLDSLQVAEIVGELLEIDDDLLNDLPYTKDEAEEMKKLLDFDFSEFDKTNDEINLDDEKYIVEIPQDIVEEWKELKEKENCSDTELIVKLFNAYETRTKE